MTESYLLSVILFAPFVGAAVLATPWVSNRQPLRVRQVAVLFAGISFVASFILLFAFDWQKGGYQFQQNYLWSEQLGIQFHLGVDGIGVPMVLASAILLFTGIFISWHIKDRTKEFYAFLLVLAGATIGVYVSLDLFFLYFFYEMSVIPMYPLLGVWGSHTKGYLETTNAEEWERPDAPRFILNFARNSKEYAAMKLTLFLSAGAVVALMGILLIYKASGLNTFEIPVLAEKAHFDGTLATIIWLLCFFGFASIAPLWPLHSWSPVGHAAAPAATSMLHAGVLMKLGHFSIIRTCFQILPDTTHDLMPIAAILCILNILYGGYVAYYSNDTKYVIGYSSSSHMGYVFLGMAALDYISLTGAVLHGRLGLRPDPHARHPLARRPRRQDALRGRLLPRRLHGVYRHAGHRELRGRGHDRAGELGQVPRSDRHRGPGHRAHDVLSLPHDARGLLRAAERVGPPRP